MRIARFFSVGLIGVVGVAGASSFMGDRVGDPFPLRDCPVAQHEIGENQDPVVRVYEGREVRFCCEDCIGVFEEDLKASLAEVDKEIIATQKPFYPGTTCLVSDEELGSMGEPIDIVWNNRLVRFCCKGCVKTFQKDPAAVIAELDEAVKAAQRDEYPLKTCLIAGEELGGMGEPTEMVVGNRLVRFCCEGCEGEFLKNPGVHLAKLDEAWKAKKPEMFAKPVEGGTPAAPEKK